MESGEELFPLEVDVTATLVIMGAAASRDWQPQHHDRDWAQNRAGTRDIFMNTPTQMGWIGRYITDQTGPEGRLASLRFQMRRPIFPGDRLSIAGKVRQVRESDGCRWLDLGVDLTTEGKPATTCAALVAMPARRRPWSLDEHSWPEAVASARVSWIS
jgi:acyl dehydratase